jgi:hypothetical protein
MANDNANQNEPIKECRCCQESDDAQNMISPCHCCGSIKHIHRNCLKQWIETSGNFQTCNVCRAEYSGQVVITRRSFLQFVTQDFAQRIRFLCAFTYIIILFLAMIYYLVMDLNRFNDNRIKRKMRSISSLTFYCYKLYLISSFSSISFIIWYLVLIEFKSWQKTHFTVVIV